MTADEARDRVTLVRAELRRAMRALCVPGPDWETAMDALGEVFETAVETYWEMENQRKGGGDA